jgi:Ca-activated chloride channel family protein
MRVRTFALWAALGVVVSTAGAMVVPAPTARGDVPRTARIESGSGVDPAQAHFVDGKTLLLDGRVGHESLPRDDAAGGVDTFVLATVTGGEPPADEQAVRPPVHMAIVVDRSGSMAGPKMANAIAAAVGVVERMHDGDRATLVAFDTGARVLVPPTSVDEATRPRIEAAIRGMRAGGDTCISCALETATTELDASPGPRDEVRRILLISDGEATTGVRDVPGLRTLASRARDHGFSISTIGVDLAFDEKVMAAIAQESNGRHWFVPDASALPGVFEQELGTLETAVATDAELTLEPAPGVVVEDVLDRSFRRESGRVRVPLGTFDAKQEKTVLVRVRVPADSDGAQPVARLALGYRDVARREDGRCEGKLAVEVRSDGSAQRELDPFVAARVERSRTAHTLTEVNDLFERGRVDEARAELARRKDELSFAKKPALAAATAIPAPARGVARPVDDDFSEQESAIAQAQAGFGVAGPSASAGGGAGNASPAAPPRPSTPAAKSAVRANQANAVDLAF